MAMGMATKKVTITLDEEQLEAVRGLVEAGTSPSVSGFVQHAIAIALNEAGASKYKSPAKNRSSLAKTERKEARGQTAEQEREGKSHVGARKRSPAKKKARTKKR